MIYVVMETPLISLFSSFFDRISAVGDQDDLEKSLLGRRTCTAWSVYRLMLLIARYGWAVRPVRNTERTSVAKKKENETCFVVSSDEIRRSLLWVKNFKK
jgi:hypothetical protein